MNYDELFLLEHKKLPLLLLDWHVGITDIIQNFSVFTSRLAPSFNKECFVKVNSQEATSHIVPYLDKDDKILVVAFPFSEDTQHIGLAKYGYVLYRGKCFDVRYFLFELATWNNGEEDFFCYFPVEYKLVSKDTYEYKLIKTTYVNDVWWDTGKTTMRG